MPLVETRECADRYPYAIIKITPFYNRFRAQPIAKRDLQHRYPSSTGPHYCTMTFLPENSYVKSVLLSCCSNQAKKLCCVRFPLEHSTCGATGCTPSKSEWSKVKFSSLSAPTKIEELTAGSDEKTQRSPAGNRTQDLANSSRTL